MRRKDEMDMQAASKPDKARKGSPASAHKALITRNLRLAFGEVASEPVPKEWMELLKKLDTPEGDKQ